MWSTTYYKVPEYSEIEEIVREVLKDMNFDLYEEADNINQKDQKDKDAEMFERQVRVTLKYVGDMLVEKNKSYGNSALDPVRVFSNANPKEQLRVRIDDKLSRIQRADENALGEDTILDLIGYLVLYTIGE